MILCKPICVHVLYTLSVYLYVMKADLDWRGINMKTLNSLHFAAPYKEGIEKSITSSNVYVTTIETNKWNKVQNLESLLDVDINEDGENAIMFYWKQKHMLSVNRIINLINFIIQQVISTIKTYLEISRRY